MPVYSFTLVVDGVDVDEDAADAVYGGGLNDATIRTFAGWQLAEIDREAASYGEALFSALRQLRAAVPDARIVRVGFLTLQDIADRTGVHARASAYSLLPLGVPEAFLPRSSAMRGAVGYGP
jgi:hypothetical protein